MSTQDDVRRLEHEFAEAMQRLYAVGNGLARLRTDLDHSGRAVTATAPAGFPAATAGASARVPVPTAPPVPAPTLGVPSGPPPLTPPQPPREPWYRREGAVTRVLAVAGAVVTLAGVAMLLVIAVRYGLFGPVARVSAGAVLAAALGALGARQGAAEVARGRAVGAAPVALVATGGAAGYLDVVAMTSGYGWLPGVAGLVLSGAVALAGLWLARRWSSELLAVLMVAGAAGFAPVVAGGSGWVLSGFLAVLAGAGWWAGGEATRPVLTIVRTTPVALSLVVGALATGSTAELLGLLAIALLVLLGTLASSAVSARRDPRDATASAALASAVVAMLTVTTSLPDPVRPTLLVLTAAVLLLAATALGRPPLGPVAVHLVVVTAVGGSTAAVLAVVTGAPPRFVTTGLLLLGAGHLAGAVVTRTRIALGLGAATGAVALLGWLQHPVAIVTAHTAVRHDMAVALVDSVLAVGLVVVAAWAAASVRGLGHDLRLAGVVVAWVVGLVASATALVAVGVLVGGRWGDPDLGFLVGQALATVTWMLAAGWLLLRSLAGGRYADLALRCGLGLAAVAVAKLFLYDLAALSGVVRSVAFIATGLLLIATGSRYAKAHERSRTTG
jgi:hypothetical protein